MRRQREQMRSNCVKEIEQWSQLARAKSEPVMREWPLNWRLLDEIRINGHVACFNRSPTGQQPLRTSTAAAAADELHAWRDFTDAAPAFGNSSRHHEGHCQQPAAEPVHTRMPVLDSNVLMSSTVLLFETFVQNLDGFFAGTLVGAPNRKGKRTQRFGTTVHPLHKHFAAALCTRTEGSVSLEPAELAVLEWKLWLQADTAAAEADGQGPRLTERTRNRRFGDIGAEDHPCAGFCNVVLEILQHSQWSVTASSAILRDALSEDSVKRRDQLQLVHRCLDVLLKVWYLEPGTVLCLPVLRSKSAKRGMFQNLLEFWTFPL